MELRWKAKCLVQLDLNFDIRTAADLPVEVEELSSDLWTEANPQDRKTVL